MPRRYQFFIKKYHGSRIRFNEAGAFAPEISAPIRRLGELRLASMRPGLLPRRYRSYLPCTNYGRCFNEAGAFAPEISGGGARQRAVYPCFNEAGAFAPEIWRAMACYTRWRWRCFNEAGAFAPEICLADAGLWAGRSRFNEAGAFAPEISLSLQALSRASGSFNEAGAFAPEI